MKKKSDKRNEAKRGTKRVESELYCGLTVREKQGKPKDATDARHQVENHPLEEEKSRTRAKREKKSIYKKIKINDGFSFLDLSFFIFLQQDPFFFSLLSNTEEPASKISRHLMKRFG